MTDIKARQLGAYVLCASETPQVQASQLGVNVVGIFPTEELRAAQLGSYVLGAAEESNGLFLVSGTQLGVYVLCRGNKRRRMRAWTFTQDDHDFYGLNLGEVETLVFDKTTKQWCQWKSPSYNYMRIADAVAWEGYNVACDPLSGKIWKIDPEGRLDEGTTPITSIVTGGLTERFRTMVPCFMAELAVSEGAPPSGVGAGEATFQLRTYDGIDWINHGTVDSTAVGDGITVRWYGLGLMGPPFKLFEITDTGYARRIDGFNIEVGEYGNPQ